MIAICIKCGAKNRLPDGETHKRYRCHKCKTSLGNSGNDSNDNHLGVAARSPTQRRRTSVNLLSISFLLLVLMIAGLIGGVGWTTADKISVGSKESLGIIMYPDERLREIARPVDNIELEEERMTELFELMKNTVAKMDAAGLSAPQVGIPERVIVVRTKAGVSSADIEIVGMVNPRITEREGTSTAIEGCLSLPRGDWKTEVTRSKTVTVRYLTLDGLEETLTASGALARQIQHEIDHLDGVLVIDYAKRYHFSSMLVIAAAIYLLVLTVAVGLYVRNRLRNRERTS